MSIESLFKMADAGLPQGLPGVSDAAAGHPFTAPQPVSTVSAGPGVPGMGAGVATSANGMPDILKTLGMRGK